MSTESLSAPYSTEFGFERTVGPKIGVFLGGLREGRLLGVRGSEERVLCPVAEFDPVTAEETGGFVELDPVGAVHSFTWVEPRAQDPLDRPFGWALIAIDGADTCLFHAVDTGGDPAALRTGLRVRARWADQRVGSIRDIVCFEPVTA
ncbi:OB-fold domain-containing protein [Nocardioides sp. GY 10113]|uniref:Zn-ribbon domain-containing OB-fold protein n=1 Tax=Nocardioides sp. GY 10113 TaxID=2569761 RepID=UPI00197ECFB6|nr:OB-fold domain-containing protein [Nocardioides sp. GY 10113]